LRSPANWGFVHLLAPFSIKPLKQPSQVGVRHMQRGREYLEVYRLAAATHLLFHLTMMHTKAVMGYLHKRDAPIRRTGSSEQSGVVSLTVEGDVLSVCLFVSYG